MAKASKVEMTEKLYVPDPSPDDVRRAQLAVVARARDVDDCRHRLDVLGIGREPASDDAFSTHAARVALP